MTSGKDPTHIKQDNETNSALIAFGQHLAALRRVRGWSQERLSLESGLARSYVGGIERGQRNLSLKNLVRLALTLDIPLGTLVDFPHLGMRRLFESSHLNPYPLSHSQAQAYASEAIESTEKIDSLATDHPEKQANEEN